MADEISLEEQLDSLDSQIREMQGAVAFTSKKERLADLNDSVTGLPNQVADIRARGYRYKGYLEGKVSTIEAKWGQAKSAMQREIDRAQRDLTPDFEELADKASALQRAKSGARLKEEIAELESKTSHMQARIDSANEAIESTISPLERALHQTESQLREAVWCMDELDAASFKLLAEENPVQGVKSKWWRDGKNKGPEGNLYLTDQRLIFEQKEEKATKKVLFVATEKETFQQKLFEASIGAVEECKSSSKGLFGHEDHLDFTFGGGVEYGNAHFHIDGQESDFWAALVKRVRNGDIVAERYYTEGESPEAEQLVLEETLAAAPEKCSACGAPFDAPLTRGQRQLQCEYCGSTMRW